MYEDFSDFPPAPAAPSEPLSRESEPLSRLIVDGIYDKAAYAPDQVSQSDIARLCESHESLRTALASARAALHLGAATPKNAMNGASQKSIAPDAASREPLTPEQAAELRAEVKQFKDLYEMHYEGMGRLAGDVRRKDREISALQSALAERREERELWRRQSLRLESALDEAKRREERYREALERIAEGRGRFSIDQIRHAENVIQDAIETARSALVAASPPATEDKTSKQGDRT